MSFSRAASEKGAHAVGNPLNPRRDASIGAARGRMPSVPRAPRAKSKPQSAGSLARDVWSRKRSNSNSNVDCGSIASIAIGKASEDRRPREESPFARISMLSREKEDIKNQQFEMGPHRITRPVSADQNFARGHVLGPAGDSGIHWSSLTAADDGENRAVARRRSIQREIEGADQGLEWVPQAARPPLPGGFVDRDHSRVNRMAREMRVNEDEGHLDKIAAAKAPSNSGYHGRKNILDRERDAEGESANAPKARGYEAGGGVPVYNRKTTLHAAPSLGGS